MISIEQNDVAMQCYVHGYELNTSRNEMLLYLKNLQCPHMPGAIQFATSVSLDIQLITYYSGERLDGYYFKNNDGTWSSLRAPQAQPSSSNS